MSPLVECFIALGSNLDGPEGQLRRAVEALERLPESRLMEVSSFYRSSPMGPQDQPDYLNAVACLHTRLGPEALLDALQAIEAAQGRVREGEPRWGPRPLDLDILLYDQLTLESERLVIPHPGVFQRNFVLYPLHEIRPDLIFPGGESLAELIKTCWSEWKASNAESPSAIHRGGGPHRRRQDQPGPPPGPKLRQRVAAGRPGRQSLHRPLL